MQIWNVANDETAVSEGRMYMYVSDLIYNDDFDLNANYRIYDCTNGKSWRETHAIFAIDIDGFVKPLNKILDMKIKYVTIVDNCIIIEAAR